MMRTIIRSSRMNSKMRKKRKRMITKETMKEKINKGLRA